MSDIKWIKVAVDMFEDSKIEFIRSLPEGDAIIVTWIQMLSIAGQSNMGGYLMVAEGIPYTEQLLSNKLRRQPVLLQFAIETLTRLKMINVEDGPYHITKWEKHQNVEGMERVRLKTNERVKKHRSKEKEKLETLPSNATVTLQVTQCNATDKELELDKEKDIVPYAEIIDYLNLKAEKNFKFTSEASREHIRARWKEGFILNDFKKAIDNKVSDWKGTKDDKYLRPQTLFNCEKFEGYVNQRSAKPLAVIDPQIESRHIEIARARWIDRGGNPSEFVYDGRKGISV